jgi:oligopeptide transport system substrate-binding protein
MQVRKRGNGAIAVGVAAMLALTACGGGDKDNDSATSEESPSASAAANGSQDGEITVASCKPQHELIPTNTNEVCGGNLLDAIMGRLVHYNSEGETENDIAESIETKDSKLYTIKLKRGVKFHDGTEVKAKNFVDAWNFGAFAGNAQLSGFFFEPIEGYDKASAKGSKTETMKGLKVVNDYTFTVKMAEKNSTFPQRLGYNAFSPLPDSFFKDDKSREEFGKKPIGAGPFKLVEADPNKEFVLEADPDYDRVGKPQIKKVIFRVYTSPEAEYNDILGNQLDFLDALPVKALAGGAYKKQLGDRAIEREVGDFASLSFPSPKSGDKSYEDVKLRRAISMAINREEIVDKIFGGTRVPATGWVSPVVAGYKAGACGEWCTYNPDRAKELFKEAGEYDGDMSIAYNADKNNGPWVEAVCNNIKETLAVTCLPKPVPLFATFRDAITKREQKGMFRTGWQMDYPSIENYLAPLYATGAGSNDGDYSNKAFDQKLKEAAGKADPEEVNKTYQEAEQMLAKDMPVIPLWYTKAVGAHSNRVADASLTVFGTYDLSSVRLK